MYNPKRVCRQIWTHFSTNANKHIRIQCAMLCEMQFYNISISITIFQKEKL